MRAAFVLVATLLAFSAVALVMADEDRPCSISPSMIPLCTGSQVPTRNSTTNCPTCRFNCNLDALRNCSSTPLRTCNDGEQPAIQNCCPTCKPAEIRCTDTKLDACKRSYNNLSICANSTKPVFNATSCCYNCRPAPPAPAERPDNKGHCTKEQFETCMNAAPVCVQGEVPEKNKTQQCCPTCKRPERLCSKEDIVECRKTTPACNATEVPIYTSGNCCPSCHLVRPNCTATCAQGTVCVRRLPDPVTGEARSPVCRNVTVARLIFRAADAARRAVIGNASCDQLVDMVKEIVNRFCDKNENADACSTFQDSFDNLYASVNSSCNARTDGTVPVDVVVPAPVDGGSTQSTVRLFSSVFHMLTTSSSSSAAMQLQSAVADPEAADGYTVEASVSNTSAAPVTAVLSVAVAVLVAFASLVVVF